MRLIERQKTEAEAQLFEFLVSVLRRQPRPVGPIIVDAESYRRLLKSPDPQIVRVVQACVENFVAEITPLPVTSRIEIVKSDVIKIVRKREE